MKHTSKKLVPRCFQAFIFVVLLVAITGCSTIINNLLSVNTREPQSNTIEGNGIRAMLWLNHFCYFPGENIHAKLTLENISEKPIQFYPGEYAPIDIRLSDIDGSYISWAETTSQITTQELILESGEIYEIDWQISSPSPQSIRMRGIWYLFPSSTELPLSIQIEDICPTEGIPSH